MSELEARKYERVTGRTVKMICDPEQVFRDDDARYEPPPK